jgi:DNA-directed RNA polymerase specialized sigma24 family protein
MPGQDQLERFQALLRGHVDALYRTALRMSRDPATAEDLVQEASLRAYWTFAAGTEPRQLPNARLGRDGRRRSMRSRAI